MFRLTDYPLLTFLVAVVLFGLSAWLGAGVLRRRRPLEESARGRLPGGAGRHPDPAGADHRLHVFDGDRPLRPAQEPRGGGSQRNWHRVCSGRPAAGGRRAAGVRTRCAATTDERILFYTTRDFQEDQKINARTAKLQNELWAAVVPAATADADDR
ncbi:MAG: hypothetical protein MZW92_74395 [Comamonadaceae bacterium]|nr:hypothetical protein [Comamonadaceae bacterium]